MASFSVDFLASMSVDGFITDQANDAVGAKTIDDELADDFGKLGGRPPAMREYSVIGRRVQWLDEVKQSQNRTDGAVTDDECCRGEE